MYPVISWTIGSTGKHGKGTHKMDFGQMPAHKHCCTHLLPRSVRSHNCSVQQVPVYWLSSAFGVTASSATTGSLPMPRDGLAGHCRISCATEAMRSATKEEQWERPTECAPTRSSTPRPWAANLAESA